MRSPCTAARDYEGKLHGSNQPGIKTPLPVLPPFYAKQRTLSPEGEKTDVKVDYTQLPAGPASG